VLKDLEADTTTRDSDDATPLAATSSVTTRSSGKLAHAVPTAPKIALASGAATFSHQSLPPVSPRRHRARSSRSH
jgi:hypothetical protein